jgi:hypothetical protein
MLYARSKKVNGYFRRMNHLNRDLSAQLRELRMTEDDVCDPEPDQDRIVFARSEEKKTPFPPFPPFPRISVKIRARTLKARKKGLFPRERLDSQQTFGANPTKPGALGLKESESESEGARSAPGDVI